MGVSNVVLMFILVWTSTAACRADKGDISVSCENVTGSVGKEVTFTCSVSLKNSECCIQFYRFQNSEKYYDSAICREEFPLNSCEQRNNFTCRFSSTTVMTGEFRFIFFTVCGGILYTFTVNITEPSKPETVTEDPEPSKPETVTEDPGRGSTALIVTGAGVGCSFVLIVMAIFCVKRFKTQQPFWIPEEI